MNTNNNETNLPTLEEFKASEARLVMSWIDWTFITIASTLVFLLALDYFDLTLFAITAAVTAVFYTIIRISKSFKRNAGRQSRGKNNQNTLLSLFWAGFAFFAGLTGTLTYLFITIVLRGGWFWVNFGIIGLVLYWWALWISRSFDLSLKDGKKKYQMVVNAKYEEWCSDLIPSALYGICTIWPIKEWPKIKLLDVDCKVKQGTQPAGKDGEDGQKVDIVTKEEDGTSFPVIPFYEYDYKPGKTFLYTGRDKPEDQIPAIVFGIVETVLNAFRDEAGQRVGNVEAFKPVKLILSERITDLLRQELDKIGIELIRFNMTAVERSKQEELAAVKSRARTIESETELRIEHKRAEAAKTNIEMLKPTIGTGAALLLTMAVGGDSQVTTIQSNPVGSAPDSKKTGGKNPGRNQSQDGQAPAASLYLAAAELAENHRHEGETNDSFNESDGSDGS